MAPRNLHDVFGLKSARLGPRGVPVNPVEFQLWSIARHADPDAKSTVWRVGRDAGNRILPEVSHLSGKVTSVEISHCDIADIAHLSRIRGLRSVKLLNAPVTDLSVLGAIPTLEYLDLARLPPECMTTLPPLPALRSLKASQKLDQLTAPHLRQLDVNGGRITDPAVLADKPDLKFLKTGVFAPADLAPIGALSKLTFLDLTAPEATDITPLSALTNLTELHLRADQVSDVSPVKSLTELQDLSLLAPAATGWECLAALTRLTKLHANGRLDPLIGELLSGLKSLRALTLAVDETTDLSAIAELAPLKHLVLFLKGPVDLRPLGAWPGLKRLVVQAHDGGRTLALPQIHTLQFFSIRDPSLTSLDGLGACHHLTELSLFSTGVTSLAPLEGLPRLSKISVYDSPLADISVLPTLRAFSYDDAELWLSDTRVHDAYPEIPGIEKIRGPDAQIYVRMATQKVMTYLRDQRSRSASDDR